MQHTWLFQVQHIEAINQLEKTRNLLRVQVMIFSLASPGYIFILNNFFSPQVPTACVKQYFPWTTCMTSMKLMKPCFRQILMESKRKRSAFSAEGWLLQNKTLKNRFTSMDKTQNSVGDTNLLKSIWRWTSISSFWSWGPAKWPSWRHRWTDDAQSEIFNFWG